MAGRSFRRDRGATMSDTLPALLQEMADSKRERQNPEEGTAALLEEAAEYIEALEAERDRYRGALEEIRAWEDSYIESAEEAAQMLDRVGTIASRALEGSETS